MSSRRVGRGRGRGSRTRARHSSSSSLFIDGGWLSEWRRPPPAAGKTQHRKKRPSNVLPNSAPAASQLVLPPHPGQAAVFVDKQPMLSILSTPTCSSSCESDEDEDDDFDGFSVESDLAEDYTDNLGPEFSIDELSVEMTLRSKSLSHDYVSANEQEYHELFLSTTDDEGSQDDAVMKRGTVDQMFVDEDSDDLDLRDIRRAIQTQTVVEPSYILDTGRNSKKTKKKTDHQKGVPGLKKKLHKETIAAKRRERALHRGVDLDSMNLMFEGMVITHTDMLALQPMKQRDLTLVSKLAAVYRLKVGSQGSGKKRFATITRTRHTTLPQGPDNDHLVKLLGMNSAVVQQQGGEAGRMAAKYKRVARQARQSLKREMFLTPQAPQGRVMRSDRRRKANEEKQNKLKQPLSFVSSGVIEPEQQESSPVPASDGFPASCSNSNNIGKFEAHTKGFGSRMLAKMGFVEGSGLGREGQGMKQPLLPQMRPKSLGLGAAGD